MCVCIYIIILYFCDLQVYIQSIPAFLLSFFFFCPFYYLWFLVLFFLEEHLLKESFHHILIINYWLKSFSN